MTFQECPQAFNTKAYHTEVKMLGSPFTPLFHGKLLEPHLLLYVIPLICKLFIRGLLVVGFEWKLWHVCGPLN